MLIHIMKNMTNDTKYTVQELHTFPKPFKFLL